ncbi:deoxyuridine 5'-triphosphate nucleotidohydrolase-like [Lycorma delicatula]|uniref:deoxyuridine 5'-triphosphate nucleotidohydrolase-like n=1 Tax=Lycorma delicatula TaxID=130591 RepID=UPI003F51983E
MEVFKIKNLNNFVDFPKYATEQTPGLDLISTIDSILIPGDIKIIATGIAISLPKKYEAQIRPRSGMAVSYGVTVVNAPGTGDDDYRGDSKVGLINLGDKDFTEQRGMRIAQMVISKYKRISWTESETLDEIERNGKGFRLNGLRQ